MLSESQCPDSAPILLLWCWFAYEKNYANYTAPKYSLIKMGYIYAMAATDRDAYYSLNNL